MFNQFCSQATFPRTVKGQFLTALEAGKTLAGTEDLRSWTVQKGRPGLQKCLGRLFGRVSYSCVFKLAPQSPTLPSTPVPITSLGKPKTKPQKTTDWNVDSHPHPSSRPCGCNTHGKLKSTVSLGWQRQCMQSPDLAFNAGRFEQPAASETKNASIVSQPWGKVKHYLFCLTQNKKKKVLKWWEYLLLP